MFHINYQVRNSKNLRLVEEDIFVESLADAVDSYQPDADLSVQIGETKIEMDVDRDMYGFHEDILKIIEDLAFDRPSYGSYKDIIGPRKPEQKIYSIRFTEAYYPKIGYFLADNKYVHLQTRTLQKDTVVILQEDTKDILCTRRDIILDVGTFLSNYLKDLIQEIPIVETLEDYKDYIERLQKIQIRALVWE
jgi:hypothetical protein